MVRDGVETQNNFGEAWPSCELGENHHTKKLTAIKWLDIIVAAMAVDTVLKTFPRDEFQKLRKNHFAFVCHRLLRQKRGRPDSSRLPKIMNAKSIMSRGYRKISQFSLDASESPPKQSPPKLGHTQCQFQMPLGVTVYFPEFPIYFSLLFCPN